MRAPQGDEPAETVAPATRPKARVPKSWASVRPASGTAVVDIPTASTRSWGAMPGREVIRSGGSGLFASEAGCVYVSAATADGSLLLTVETHPEPPPLELEGWEDVWR